MKKTAALRDVLAVILYVAGGALCNIDRLELVMPRYAIRGGDVTLLCDHSVPPEQLYKVEWRRADTKIFQYIKGRKPPFIYHPMTGAELNKTNSNERQVQLSRLDFAASGSYSCTVSMETPIFSKDSDSKDLTIIEPQDDNPTIVFDKDTYEIGDILQANCTTAPSKPPPHITWLINNEKVPDHLTKSFSPSGVVHGHGYFDTRSYSVKQLAIEVSELHVGDDGTLTLICLSTIPGYVNSQESYADRRSQSVQIDIEMTEGPVEAVADEMSSARWYLSSALYLALSLLTFTYL